MELHSGQTSLHEVPPTEDIRELVWAEALTALHEISRTRALRQAELEEIARNILRAVQQDERFLGHAMVMANNAFWLDQFLAVPRSQRLLLLPRCLVNLPEIRATGERLGYKICVAEGSPEVVQLLAHENVNAILGIGCLDSLEKIFSKVSALGTPSIAIPLSEAGCVATRVDMRLANWLIESEGAAVAHRTQTYLPLLRMAHSLFDTDLLDAMLSGLLPNESDPTTQLSLEWLRGSGKRLRPFFTLAAWRAFCPDAEMSGTAQRLALAVEAFHKASLVHDDIEDDEDDRYGELPLHRTHGVPVAINIGDYLIGLGYRLVASADADLLPLFSVTQMKLTQGQGMELFWRKDRSVPLELANVLRCCNLKTSAAFEVSLASALTLAGAYVPHADAVKVFSRHLGTAFQLKNDIDGYRVDSQRVHPTVLLALALERASVADKEILLRPGSPEEIDAIYARYGVMERANALAQKLKTHAIEVAEQHPGPLGDLFHFLVETVLG
ncbi:TPA: hypothetical protein DDW35_11640 [Candidatus Sumerlaeota bacterium]|jgi:geranylgeranyl diphosphate synthase, type II|nr:hypothetical protein [Candidatus Sumerlaeota bacterium]